MGSTLKKGVRRKEISYKSNIDIENNKWIVGKKKVTKFRYDGGQDVIEKKIEYFHDGSDQIEEIDKGLVTKIRRYDGDSSTYGDKHITYTMSGTKYTESDFKDIDATTEYFYHSQYSEYVEHEIQNYETGQLVNYYEWDNAHSNILMHEDQNGLKNYSSYDGFGRVVSESWEDGMGVKHPIATYIYEDFSNPAYSEVRKVIDENVTNMLSVSRTYYDGFGRAIQNSSNHDGAVTIVRFVEYDELGRLKRVSVPEFYREYYKYVYYPDLEWEELEYRTFEYDEMDRIVEIVDPVNQGTTPISKTFSYGNDLSTTMVDEEGLKIKTINDGWGNIAELKKDPDNLDDTTFLEYDSNNLIIKASDIHGTIEYERDLLGNIVEVIFPEANSIYNYGYDTNGNILWSTSAESRRIDYTYDKLQRVTTREFEKNGIPDGSVSYTYDVGCENGTGRLCSATSEAGTYSYDYDERGRITDVVFNSSESSIEYTTQYTYNDAGLVTTTTYPDNVNASYSYNPDGTKNTLRVGVRPAVYEFSAKYNPMRMTNILHFESPYMFPYSPIANSYYTYDPNGRIARIETVAIDGGTQNTIMDRDLRYLDNGKIDEVHSYQEGISYYTYDSLGRLDSWNINGGIVEEDYEFYADTRLWNVERENTNLSFDYNDNQFPWAVTNLVDSTSGDMTIYTYDDDGIIESSEVDGTTTLYTYNARGLIEQVYKYIFDYRKTKYDHTDRPAHYRTGVWGSSTDIVGEHYENKYLSGVTTKYIYFNGKRVAKIDSDDGIKLLYSDERGSVRFVTDIYGNELERHEYRPYGEEYNTTGNETDFRFSDMRSEGYELLRTPARMLSKEAYHWQKIDPLSVASPGVLVVNNMNPYAYAGYDPVNNVDTTGEMFAGIDIRSPRSLRNLLLIPGPGGNNPKEEENDDSSSDDNESSNDNEEKEEENVEKGDDHGWKDGRPVRRGKTEPHKKQKNPKNMKRIRKDIGEIEKEIVKEMKNDKKGRKKRIRNLKRKKKHLQQMLEQMEEHWNRHNPNKQRPNRNILIFDAPPSWFRL